jgi:hypothetical protein
MNEIDEHDSATPEPGYEGMSYAEIVEAIEEAARENRIEEQERNRILSNRWSEFQ